MADHIDICCIVHVPILRRYKLERFVLYVLSFDILQLLWLPCWPVPHGPAGLESEERSRSWRCNRTLRDVHFILHKELLALRILLWSLGRTGLRNELRDSTHLRHGVFPRAERTDEWHHHRSLRSGLGYLRSSCITDRQPEQREGIQRHWNCRLQAV